MSLKLIVGLGNPGKEYVQTRHNAGVWDVEQLAERFQVSWRAESRFWGLTTRIQTACVDVRLLVPTTFMNVSGKAVAAMANFYQIDIADILIAHDELALEPGTVRLKQGGGHAGHNGLKSVIACCGNQKDFVRLRIGIGHPGEQSRVSGFVLGKAPSQEQHRIDDAIQQALSCSEILLQEGVIAAMNRLHAPSP